MQKKTVIFICAVLAVVLTLSIVSAVQSRNEMNLKKGKVEPTVKQFIEIMNNATVPEYKSMYWDLLSQRSKDALIQKTGSEKAAQTMVWLMLQDVVDAQRYVEYQGIEYTDIQGDILTVVVKVRVAEGGGEPQETTIFHKYRWENGEWKFIDWLLEPDMYKG